MQVWQPPAKLEKWKGTQINKIRDENGDITTETSEVKTIRTCLKVVYSNTF